MDASPSGLRCTACSATVPVVDGIARFPLGTDDGAGSALFEALAPVYETPLWFPWVYRLVGGPFAPADDRATVAASLGTEPDTVLDVACGTGRFTRFIARRAGFAWGIDRSVPMLRQARRSADREGRANLAFAVMDAAALRFQPDAFDAVACCWALHLFPAVPDALREVHRVLTAGGRFAGVTLAAEAVMALPGVEAGLRGAVGARAFDRETFVDRLRAVGFEDVRLDVHGAALFFSAAA